MWPIGYVYDADHWCHVCLPVSENDDDVAAMFEGEECDYPMHCASCGQLIRGVLTSEGFARIKEDYLEYRWRNRNLIEQWMDAFDYFEWHFIPTFYGWMDPLGDVIDLN